MYNNTTANDNNAMGYVAMFTNTTGTLNNAVGNFSLYYNTTGSNNNAVGYAALYRNTTGSNNSAQGFYALQNNTVGSNNIAIGQFAGNNITGGSSNIDIGSRGVYGDVGTIRIGDSTSQSSAYIAGVSSAKVTGSAVYVTSTGQLGVMASSERYKTAIASMGSTSEKLQQLRPVTFHLKTDPQGVTQYGLIAEEVAKVYPELVIRNGAGKIEGVRYEELAPMLLNEVQQQQQRLAAQGKQLHQMQQQQQKIATQEIQLHDMKHELEQEQVALALLQAKDGRLAHR
jgi:Chaperone of endosialidase